MLNRFAVLGNQTCSTFRKYVACLSMAVLIFTQQPLIAQQAVATVTKENKEAMAAAARDFENGSAKYYSAGLVTAPAAIVQDLQKNFSVKLVSLSCTMMSEYLVAYNNTIIKLLTLKYGKDPIQAAYSKI